MGSIISFDSEKGFGFIKLDEGRHLFFHVSDVCCSKEQLQIGEKVVFAIKEYPKNGIMVQKAVSVQIA